MTRMRKLYVYKYAIGDGFGDISEWIDEDPFIGIGRKRKLKNMRKDEKKAKEERRAQFHHLRVHSLLLLS